MNLKNKLQKVYKIVMPLLALYSLLLLIQALEKSIILSFNHSHFVRDQHDEFRKVILINQTTTVVKKGLHHKFIEKYLFFLRL